MTHTEQGHCRYVPGFRKGLRSGNGGRRRPSFDEGAAVHEAPATAIEEAEFRMRHAVLIAGRGRSDYQLPPRV